MAVLIITDLETLVKALATSKLFAIIFVSATMLILVIGQSHAMHHQINGDEHIDIEWDHFTIESQSSSNCDDTNMADGEQCDSCGSLCQSLILAACTEENKFQNSKAWRLLTHSLSRLYTSDPVPPPISFS